MDTVTIAVEGIPAPQGSKRHIGNGRMIEVSKRLKPWRQSVATATRAVMGRRLPLDCAVAIHLQFVMPRPVSTPKRLPTPPAVKRPDIDKTARACLDAITGIAICDDSQVVDLRATKRIAELGERPGVVIEITDLSGDAYHRRIMAQRGDQAPVTPTEQDSRR